METRCWTSTTFLPVRLLPTSIAGLTRVKLSTNVKSLIRPPLKSSSCMKSIDQTWFGAVASDTSIRFTDDTCRRLGFFVLMASSSIL